MSPQKIFRRKLLICGRPISSNWMCMLLHFSFLKLQCNVSWFHCYSLSLANSMMLQTVQHIYSVFLFLQNLNKGTLINAWQFECSDAMLQYFFLITLSITFFIYLLSCSSTILSWTAHSILSPIQKLTLPGCRVNDDPKNLQKQNGRLFSYQAPPWNHLPVVVLEADTLSDFKSSLKTLLF